MLPDYDPVTRSTVETVVDSAVQLLTDVLRRRLLGRDTRLTRENVEKKYEALTGTYIHREFEDGEVQSVYWIDGEMKVAPRKVKNAGMNDEQAQILKESGFGSILEVGAGELTTLTEIAGRIGLDRCYHGIDISFGRVYQGTKYFSARVPELDMTAVRADAMSLPYPNDSFDIVFSSHCLEHIPLHYQRAIDEMIRVARRAVVLFEPSYELNGPVQKLRMRAHGYVRGIEDYLRQLPDVAVRPTTLLRHGAAYNRTACHFIDLANDDRARRDGRPQFGCPRCRSILHSMASTYRCNPCSLAYPIIDGVADLGPGAAYQI